MTYCKYCGSAVDSDAVFCVECGKRIKEIPVPVQSAHSPEQEAIITVRGDTIPAEELMHTDPEKVKAYMDRVTKYRMSMAMLNQFYNTLDEWSDYDLEMWDEMETVMRRKYDIPEISIYRFLKPERREQITPQDRHNRPYAKKDTEYWAKFERKKTD